MIKLPFNTSNQQAFAAEFKKVISGVNVTLDPRNVESSMCKAAVSLYGIFTRPFFDALCDGTASADEEKGAAALDYLRRAVAHFTIYQHLIFLITRIGNDGVTVKKNDDETTVFKYQQDQLSDNLITTGWFWINLLIGYLNDNKDDFPGWNPDTNSDIPIDVSDFEKWVGVSDAYFVIVVRSLIREVWMECVESRKPKPVAKDNYNARALCYDVMARACTRLAYMELPEPVRRDISNEMGKNHNAQADTYIREKVAGIYARKAIAYWTDWDVVLKKEAVKNHQKETGDPPRFGSVDINQHDKFYFS
ncbi:MAG: hypothetical protein LBQ74_14510 [Prevotella sp.]|jgi:hypothetical protein|nr:hypothetical protein [Prevotella sp.]